MNGHGISYEAYEQNTRMTDEERYENSQEDFLLMTEHPEMFEPVVPLTPKKDEDYLNGNAF